jgi:ABC-type antimicrobial peptide transport system permease subunit
VGVTFLWGEPETIHRVVGVVRSTKNMTIGEDEEPQLYQSFGRFEKTRFQFVIRSAVPPAALLASVREALRSIEPSAGLEVATLYSSIGMAFLPSQVGAILMGSIGALGLLLAAVGLYGVLAYSVTRRTREIGIRIAVGAGSGDISRMVLSEAVRLLAVGSLVGLGIALVVTRPLAMFLVPGLSPSDPITYAAVVVVFAVTGLLASLAPMRRAVRMDANRCLRSE